MFRGRELTYYLTFLKYLGLLRAVALLGALNILLRFYLIETAELEYLISYSACICIGTEILPAFIEIE